jgi:PKD domain
VLALLVSALGAATARADTPTPTALYVYGSSSTCSDSGPGTQDEPYCSLQVAADAALPGQTVYFLESGGKKPIVLTHSGTPGYPITFTSWGNGPSFISTTQSVVPLTISGAHDLDFENIGIQGDQVSAVQLTDAHDVTFDHVYFDSSTDTADPGDNSLNIDGQSSDVTVSKSNFGTFRGYGVAVQPGASGVIATDDQFGGVGYGGILADSATDVTVTADTFINSCGSAVDFEGTSTGSIENVVAQGEPFTPTFTKADCAATPAPEIAVSADSALGVHSDYNGVQAGSGEVNYNWGGTTYSSSSLLHTDTEEGAHDLNQLGTNDNGVPLEGSPLIDSADANAPDQPTTDYSGLPRVDDPLVPNTGTGTVDRGSIEFQDPIAVTGRITLSTTSGTAPLPVTATVPISNPWSTPGISTTFDFGDGSPPVTVRGDSATHSYDSAGPAPYGFDEVTATVQLPGETSQSLGPVAVEVLPPTPLAATVNASSAPARPDVADIHLTTSGSWPAASAVVSYGDHSPSMTIPFTNDAASVSHTYPAPGSYTLTGTVTDSFGRTSTFTHTVIVGAAYVAVTPRRILDTRSGLGARRGPVGPQGVIRLKIAGANGLPATGISSVVLNVTDADATSGSWVSVYPDGSARATTSNLNFTAGQVNPNLVTVSVGADGYVDLYNNMGDVDLIADVQGYYTTRSGESANQSYYVPDSAGPQRVIAGANRAGQPIGSGVSTFTLPATGVPPHVTAAVLSISQSGSSTAGWLAAFPGTGAAPTSSDLNFTAGETTSDMVIVPITSLRTFRILNHGSSLLLTVDLQGYYTTSSGAAFVPVAPTRILDTRNGTGESKAAPIGPGGTVGLNANTLNGTAIEATTLLYNLTGIAPTTATWLSAIEDGPTPNTTNLHLTSGQVRPVLVMGPTWRNEGSSLTGVYNSAGKVNIAVDLEGYFTITT